MKQQMIKYFFVMTGLLPLTGCTPFLLMEEEGSVMLGVDETEIWQETEEDWASHWSFGVTTNTLFEKMNTLNPQLNLDEHQLHRSEESKEFEYSKIGLLNGNVLIQLQCLESYNTKNPLDIGTLVGIHLGYDRTNHEAVAYVQSFINTFNQLGLQDLLAPEHNQVNGSFETYTLDVSSSFDDAFEGLDDQTLDLLNEADITEETFAMINISR